MREKCLCRREIASKCARLALNARELRALEMVANLFCRYEESAGLVRDLANTALAVMC